MFSENQLNSETPMKISEISTQMVGSVSRGGRVGLQSRTLQGIIDQGNQEPQFTIFPAWHSVHRLRQPLLSPGER